MGPYFNSEEIKTRRDKYLEYTDMNKEKLETLKRIYEDKVYIKDKISIINNLSKKFGKDIEGIILKYVPKIFLIFLGLILIYTIFGVLNFHFKWISFLDNPNLIIILVIVLVFPMIFLGVLIESIKNSPNERELRIIKEVLNNKYTYQDKMITPETPFSNENHMIETISGCEGYIHWMDKYFNKNGLNLLSKGLQTSKVKEIKIITTLSSDPNEELRKSFIKLKEELKNKGISIELRILSDKNLLNQLHNRFLFSAGICYDLPSPDIISRGQISSITRVDGSKINFQKYWSKSLDILKKWNKISLLFSKSKKINS